MITPLMLLLSSINEKFEFDSPVEIGYLSRSNANLIRAEADRLGKMAVSEDYLQPALDGDFNPIEGSVGTTQYVDGKQLDISLATAMILTRVREAYKVYKRTNPGDAAGSEDDIVDIGLDTVILRLEGNPYYIYSYVCEVMNTKHLSFRGRMMKLIELYSSIFGHVNTEARDLFTSELLTRLELHSTLQFWQSLIMSDMLKRGYVGNYVSKDDIVVVGEELRSLGFYGFVNPLKMYQEFSNSQIQRKVDVNIDEEVITFLEKVVRSGGVA